MIETAYDRIAATIRLGGGSQLVAVLVPPKIQMLVAMDELRSQLNRRGIQAHPIRIVDQGTLLESVEIVTPPGPSRAFIIYGIEAMPRIRRESYLRATSFARDRLRGASKAIILALGIDTWSWIGMQLPDLARWLDGPFLMSGDEAG